MYKCPQCGSIELNVQVETACRLMQGDEGCATEYLNGDHYWGDENTMWCTKCGYQECSEEFEVEE